MERSLNAYDVKSGPQDAPWTYQEHGYMVDILGEKWFSEHFLNHIGPERLQILIMDGHSSHESLGLIHRARQANIILIALPPHII